MLKETLIISIYIVTSSTNPYFEIGQGNVIFNLGYHVDRTDVGGRAGHYVSLIPKVPRTPLPDPDIFNTLVSESKILNALYMDRNIVSFSIDRMKKLDIDYPSIIKSNVLETLKTVKDSYSSTPDIGISVRQLIAKCNNILVTANRADQRVEQSIVEEEVEVYIVEDDGALQEDINRAVFLVQDDVFSLNTVQEEVVRDDEPVQEWEPVQGEEETVREEEPVQEEEDQVPFYIYT